jgi:hypothetical protein
MNAPVTHIIPITNFRRERALQFPGRILVRKGQKVAATDIVAEADLRAEHFLIDFVRVLGVSSRQVDKYIKVEEGAQLEIGDLLAGPVGFPGRRVYSPVNGQVILIDGGQMLIEITGQPIQLKAGVPGEVVELISDKGVIIETTGALIQGVWGNGKIEFGLMSVLAKNPDHVITPDQVDVSLRGSIVLAGYCEDPEVLKNAEELPLRGLILASLSPSLVVQARKLRLPLLLTEGFGKRRMNPAAHKLLSTNDRREVALNAEVWNPLEGTRPEIVIPLPGSSSTANMQDSGTFAPNQQVRVLRAPFAGEIGTLLSLKGVQAFPSGLHTSAAEVRLESGNNAVVPLANLEIIA